MYEELKEQAKKTTEEICDKAGLKEGNILVVGKMTVPLHAINQEIGFFAHRSRLLRVIIGACQKFILIHGIQRHRAVVPQF